ncbi:MAG: hypothetical protein U5K29_13410 [Acidimicrobiales bacterium]|nr:hypothetical protein [Acidimicrobiales bacterium]
MSHMVIFRTPEGKPGYQPADTVEEAVAVVERLRNEDGVENVRIFRLEEVAFEYKPYYKVELADGGGDESRGRSAPTAILGRSSPTDVDEAGAAGDEAGAEDDGGPVDAGGDDEASTPADETFAPESETPPWAAPPPPPPAPVVEPPAAEVGGFGDEAGDAPAEDYDDEFSGAGGQRRGLFGR